ncbi:hypothetical protein PRZ48_009399 [Zasmidium cellare]|uniref:Uncharacterized protein n=1 Tax=Zasmidium cellare TaxID=395010 RepID=A0ABR0EBM3_ZASCE|nr:hypothetical protein PRZ48_009399 [Zasmidium cellare]
MPPDQAADMPSTTSPESMQLTKANTASSAASTPMLSSDPSLYTPAAVGGLSDSANPPTSTRFSPAASTIAGTLTATNHNQLPTSSTSTASASIMTSSKATYLRKMMQDDPERYIFRFFDLPRELRDLAYDELLISHVFIELECRLEVDACEVVRPNLMTISRQFAREYKERSEKKQVTTVSDRPPVVLHGLTARLMPLPNLLRNTKKLSIYVFGAPDVLELHKNWILATVTALPRVESLSLRVVLDMSGGQEINLTLAALHGLVTIQKVTLLEIFAMDNRHGVFSLSDQRLLVLRWSAEGGLWEKFNPDGLDPRFTRVLEEF